MFDAIILNVILMNFPELTNLDIDANRLVSILQYTYDLGYQEGKNG